LPATLPPAPLVNALSTFDPWARSRRYTVVRSSTADTPQPWQLEWAA
jgi:hypothetical protein